MNKWLMMTKWLPHVATIKNRMFLELQPLGSNLWSWWDLADLGVGHHGLIALRWLPDLCDRKPRLIYVYMGRSDSHQSLPTNGNPWVWMIYGLWNDEKLSLLLRFKFFGDRGTWGGLDITTVGHPPSDPHGGALASMAQRPSEAESTRGAVNATDRGTMRIIGPSTLAANGCETKKFGERFGERSLKLMVVSFTP